MIEKHILLEDADTGLFYGPDNANIRIIKALYPRLRIIARGNVIKAIGEEEETASFERVLHILENHLGEFNSLTEEDIVSIVKNGKALREHALGVIVYGASGKPITAHSANQCLLVEAYESHDMIFAIGPAGSGKTYTAIALAVRALKEKRARRIVLSRPAVEAGEKLGFLPGDMKEKIDPYLQPLYDALQDMIPLSKLQEMTEQGIIQIAPLAFMRGRTLNDAVVILDEAQNATTAQVKMFLTRMGVNTKMIITGDVTQVDLPRGQRSGLSEAAEILSVVEGIAFIHLDKTDIVRHKLVTRIVEAYEAHEKSNKSI